MTEKTWNLSKNKWPSTENKEAELVQPVKMNIRQSNTYIKDCSWLQLYDDLRVHKRQKVLDEQSYIPVSVATDYQICTDGKLKNHVKKCEGHWLSSSITSQLFDYQKMQIWYSFNQNAVEHSPVNFCVKNRLKRLGKLRNFSTAPLSCLNSKQKHFWTLLRSFGLFLRQNWAKTNQNRCSL